MGVLLNFHFEIRTERASVCGTRKTDVRRRAAFSSYDPCPRRAPPSRPAGPVRGGTGTQERASGDRPIAVGGRARTRRDRAKSCRARAGHTSAAGVSKTRAPTELRRVHEYAAYTDNGQGLQREPIAAVTTSEILSALNRLSLYRVVRRSFLVPGNGTGVGG